MTYASLDRSVENSAPIELFTFTSRRASPNEIVARSTSYHRDVVVIGATYVARPIRRGAASMGNVSANADSMTVEVPIGDPAAQFYLTSGVPPQGFTIEIIRLQRAGGDAAVFRGTITECRVHGETAVFSVDQALESLATTLPGWQVSKRCQRTLFDAGCGLSRDASDIPTTLTTIFDDPRDLHVAAVGMFGGIGGYDEGEFKFGELLHLPSGERRSITLATPTRFLRLDVRLPSTALVGDAVLVWRGCDKKATTCRDRFANIVNFGGCNQLPRNKPSIFDRTPGVFRVPKDPV